MPELPEVEAARRAVAEHSIGKKIVKAIVAADAKVIDGVSPTDFEAALVGKTIVAAHRKGKNMWIELDSPPFPSFQFGNVSILLYFFFILKTLISMHCYPFRFWLITSAWFSCYFP